MIRLLLLCFLSISLSGCSVGYILRSGYEQAKILNQRKPIDKVLKDPQQTDETKQKLELVQKIKVFAETELQLKKSKNYKTYVDLKRPYVSWLLRVSDKDQLKAYTWWFPITGSFPYKGYFKKESALEEAEKFKHKGYDVYTRGVTAYSTLGWFNDPVLSSMLRYPNHGLVELIIHETIHENLFIKNSVEFNERLATFLGEKGAELFYKQQSPINKTALKALNDERHDRELFSDFISDEIKQLKDWYKQQTKPLGEELREQRLKSIQANFLKLLKPKMRTKIYNGFAKRKINNASLLSYETYIYDMSDFEKAYKKLGSSFSEFLKFCKSLEKHKKPAVALKEFAYKDPLK